MPKLTPYMVAADKAQSHLLKGFDMAWKRAGQVQLGHHILDPRTMESRDMTNIAVTNNPVGMTSGLPQVARKMYQQNKPINKPKGEGQTEKNRAAGLIVDPTSHETFTGTDQIAADLSGGYGLTPLPFPSNG